MAAGQNVNMRIPDELLERIDTNATTHGLSRTQYILSWLPETYDSNADQAAKLAANDRR